MGYYECQVCEHRFSTAGAFLRCPSCRSDNYEQLFPYETV